MARIRTIKPEFWDHDQLNRASPLARLTFLGLISLADDDGRGHADAQWLWSRLHSGQHPNVRRMWSGVLSELARLADHRGPLVVFYTVGDSRYYWLPGFCRQQRIERRSESRLPAPPISLQDQGSGIKDQGGEGRSGAVADSSATPPPSLSQSSKKKLGWPRPAAWAVMPPGLVPPETQSHEGGAP